MFDVVCVGGATQDVFIKSDLSKIIRISDVLSDKEYLSYDYGSKVGIEDIQFLTGGGATNTAVSFARLGLSAAFLGKVSKTDDAGARIVAELREEGVDTSRAVYSNSQPTGYSVILVSYAGDRTALTFRGANNTLGEDDIDWAVLDETKWLYMSSLSGRSAQMAQAIARRAAEKGVKLAFNPGSTQLKTRIRGLRSILKTTEILIINREEAEMLTGIEGTRHWVDDEACNLCGKCVEACGEGIFQEVDGRIVVRNVDLCRRCGDCMKACRPGAILLEPWTYNLFEIFRALVETGVKLVVITDGRAGAQASDGESIYYFPPYSAPVVDTLGAGDSFGSGLVAGFIRNGDIQWALKLASANASSVVRYFGAKQGLLTLEEAEDIIRQKEKQEGKIHFVRKIPFRQRVTK